MYEKKNKTLKVLVAVLSVILVMSLTVAGTLAYLQVKTEPVVNTFAPSNIDLVLVETTNTYKMVPGVDIAKDPKVTVSGDVDAYVFVKIEEAGSVTVDNATYTLDDFLAYAIADGWTVHEGQDDTNDANNGNETVVIYREVTASATSQTFSVLANDKVTTNDGVTKQMMNAYTDDSIKLTFTAYAIQKEGFATSAAAWDEAKGSES